MRRLVPFVAGLVAWVLVVPGLDAAIADSEVLVPSDQVADEAPAAVESPEPSVRKESRPVRPLPPEVQRLLQKMDTRRAEVMKRLGIPTTRDSVSGKIIGGTNAEIGDVPWQVFLAYGFDYSNGGEIDFGEENPFAYEFFCGGSIIDSQWIVTAAHCVEFDSRPYLYVAAGVDTNVGVWREDFYQVSQIFVHPQFDYLMLENDIALLKLAEPIDLNGVPEAIDLPGVVLDSWPEAGTPGLISGWGAVGFTDSELELPARLQKGDVFVLASPQTSECGIFVFLNVDTTLCVGRPQGETSACFGDSGGPLAIEVDGDVVLAGIASFVTSYSCAAVGYPNGYTRVTSYVQWVESITRAPQGTPLITLITPGNRSLTVEVDDSDLSGDPVTNYQYSLNNGRWTSVSPADSDGVFTIGGLRNGRRYSVRVRAVNDFGVSDPSPSANGTPVAGVPSAATIESVSPGNRTLSLQIVPPIDDGGSKISSYEYSIDGGKSWKTIRSTANPLTIGGLKNGREYTVIIRARTAHGPGQASGPVVGTPVAPPKR